MTHDISKAYKLVDTTIGARLLLSFIVSPLALQRRLRPPGTSLRRQQPMFLIR